MPLSAGAQEPTYIGIQGPTQFWHPSPPLALDVPGAQYRIVGSNLLRVHAQAPFEVVVRDPSDCSVVVRFTARKDHPDRGYSIYIDERGDATVRSWRGPVEIGGTLEPTDRPRCLDLPDTATATSTGSASLSVLHRTGLRITPSARTFLNVLRT